MAVIEGFGFDQHPVWKDIQNYGSEDKCQSQIAFMVYMDICEGKGWWNVKTHVCKDLCMVFLSGHESRKMPREIILPISADTSLSAADIQTYLKTICLPEYTADGLILAICASDSSTVYYKVTDGLVLPAPPEVTEWKKYRREEMHKLQKQHVGEQKLKYIKRKQMDKNVSTTEDTTT